MELCHFIIDGQQHPNVTTILHTIKLIQEGINCICGNKFIFESLTKKLYI